MSTKFLYSTIAVVGAVALGSYYYLSIYSKNSEKETEKPTQETVKIPTAEKMPENKENKKTQPIQQSGPTYAEVVKLSSPRKEEKVISPRSPHTHHHHEKKSDEKSVSPLPNTFSEQSKEDLEKIEFEKANELKTFELMKQVEEEKRIHEERRIADEIRNQQALQEEVEKENAKRELELQDHLRKEKAEIHDREEKEKTRLQEEAFKAVEERKFKKDQERKQEEERRIALEEDARISQVVSEKRAHEAEQMRLDAIAEQREREQEAHEQKEELYRQMESEKAEMLKMKIMQLEQEMKSDLEQDLNMNKDQQDEEVHDHDEVEHEKKHEDNGNHVEKEPLTTSIHGEEDGTVQGTHPVTKVEPKVSKPKQHDGKKKKDKGTKIKL
jgi:hypothetical protein